MTVIPHQHQLLLLPLLQKLELQLLLRPQAAPPALPVPALVAQSLIQWVPPQSRGGPGHPGTVRKFHALLLLCLSSFFFFRHFKSPALKWRLRVAREAAGDADGIIGMAVPMAPVDVAVAVAAEELDHD